MRICCYNFSYRFTPQSDNKWLHFQGQRTVNNFLSFIKECLQTTKHVVSGILIYSCFIVELPQLNMTAGQDGCRLQGAIVVPRMSGNFHISCHGSHSYILPSEVNVSHRVCIL